MVRQGFEEVVTNSFASYGFNAEAPVTYVFSAEMFVENSDLTPLEEHFDEFIVGLTEWQPEMTSTGVVTPDMIEITATDELGFRKAVNNLFVRNLWRDSLPIEPPTEDLVNWILTGTDMAPDDLVSSEGGIKPRGGIARVRDVAVALAMAGGRPEYLPVTIACVKGIAEPTAGTQSWNTTTCSIFPVFVVNGPMVREIRLGSGYGLLGADPMHPAGHTIGRAIRFILQNLGGATVGAGTMSIFGINRGTNTVIAEDEEGLPETWTTLAEDRGFTRDQNVVTLTWANGISNILWDFGDSEANHRCLNGMAGQMTAPNNNRYAVLSACQNPKNLPTGVSLFPRSFAKALQDVDGYSKSDVKKYLWEHAMITHEDLESWKSQFVLEDYVKAYTQPNGMIPVCPDPEQLTVVVAGGDQGGHGCWLQSVCFGEMQSVVAEKPAKWDDLLLDAEIDFGPIPAAH